MNLRTIATATAAAISSAVSTVGPVVVQAGKEAYSTITSSVAEEKAVANNRKQAELLASLLEKAAKAHCLPSDVDSVVFTINGVFLKSRREAEIHLWGLGLSYDQSSSMLDRLQEDAVADWHAMFCDITLEQEYTVYLGKEFIGHVYGGHKESYRGVVEVAGDDSHRKILEKIFYVLNNEHPEDYSMRSLSIGDIVRIDDNLYRCDAEGWTML